MPANPKDGLDRKLREEGFAPICRLTKEGGLADWLLEQGRAIAGVYILVAKERIGCSGSSRNLGHRLGNQHGPWFVRNPDQWPDELADGGSIVVWGRTGIIGMLDGRPGAAVDCKIPDEP